MIRPTEQWSESMLRAIGLTLAGITTLGVVANVVMSASIGDLGNSTEQVLLLVPFVVVLVWLFRAVPRNAAVWALAWAAICGGVGDTADTLTLWRTGQPVEAFTTGLVAGSPADLDWLSAAALNVAAWSWLGIFLLSVHFVLLFPSGHVSSPRWRYVLRLVTGVFALGVGVTALALAPWVETSFAELFDQGVFWATGMASLVMIVASVAAIINLVVRFWRSSGEERLQYRWVTWAFATWVVILVGLGWLSGSAVFDVLYIGALAGIPVSIAIAITKYRLYDIDIVISRTLVYGALAVFIGAVYVGIVVGFGSLLGSPETDIWLQILATVIIAIVFQPLRRWLQRVANRVVFGRRATPYEVLSSFSQGVSAVDPMVLTEVSRSLAEGTTAHSASIWMERSDHLQCLAAWPELPADAAGPSAVAEPVVHEGETLGRVVLNIPPGQPFPVTDRRLLEQVAAGLGLALRNLLLTENLRDRVEELAASRRRIVSVQDDTRRRLERDLHDGAQQRLVALKIKLGITSSLAGQRGLSDVETMLDSIKHETDDTIESVRDFARGIYPPLLEAEGLAPALNARGQKMGIPVTVQAAGLGRYPKEHEAGIYFCVLEALQNAGKHSGAGSIVVSLEEADEVLRFEVRDDGAGFDVEKAEGGHGLVNMVDRIEAMGGELRILSVPGHGTRVVGSIPVPVALGAR